MLRIKRLLASDLVLARAVSSEAQLGRILWLLKKKKSLKRLAKLKCKS